MYNLASIYKGGGVYNLGDGESTKIPANTLRFLFSKSDYDPTVAGVGSSGTWQKVDTAAANVWDWTKSGTSFEGAFSDAFKSSDNLVSVIAAGDTSSITTTRNMFAVCTSLTSVALFDTSNVTTFRTMFDGCTSLTSVPLFDMSNAETIRSMFYGCTSLTSVPPFNTSNVTEAYAMFNGCTSLTSVPLFDTSNVTDFNFMFYGCTSLTSVPLFDTSKATIVSSMLKGCTKVEGGALALYQQLSTQETPPTNHFETFLNCGKNTETGASELAQIPESWGGTAPESLNMGAPQNLTEPISPSVIDGDDSLTK